MPRYVAHMESAERLRQLTTNFINNSVIISTSSGPGAHSAEAEPFRALLIDAQAKCISMQRTFVSYRSAV